MRRLLGGVLLTLALCLAAGAGGGAVQARPGAFTAGVTGAAVPCDRDRPPGGGGGSAPGIDFDDTATTELVGASHDLTGSVTGTTGGTVRVRVVSGPNAGDELEVTRRGATFAAVHRSEEPGDDVLAATLVVAGDVVAEARTRHTWTERDDVEDLVVRVAPQESTGPVGERHSVRITVEGTDGTGKVTTRVVDGPHAGDLPVSGSGTGFSATYEGEEPGTDTIQATLRFGGRTVTSNTASRTWQQPSEPVSVTLSPSGTTAQVGERHQLEIEVQGSDERPVLQVVDGVNGKRSLDVAGGERRYSAIYSSKEAGTDALQALLRDTGVESNVVEHTWTAPPERVPDPSISIAPGQARTPLGGVHTVTVRVSDTEEKPRLTLVRAGSSGGEELALDPVGGDAYVASYEFDDQEVGTDRLVASVTGATAQATNTWFKIVIGAPAGPRAVELVSRVTRRTAPIAGPARDRDCLTVVLAPAGARSQVGTDVTMTALVRDDRGDPVDGARVDFVAANPGTDDATARVSADSDGVARFTYLRDNAGTDTVTARATADIGTGTGSTTHAWLADDGLTVSVLPDATTSAVGIPFTATVSVVDDDGEPVEDAEVDVAATMPEASPPEEAGGGVTDDHGRFSFTYTRDVAGSDTIAVTARDGDREAASSASHVWESARGLGVELQPASTTTLVGSEFTATALVTRDGQPIDGADVSFTAAMTDAGPDDIDSATVTSADGLASFGYTRDVEGDEVVSVVVTADNDTAEAAMAHSWVLVPDLAVVITPAGTSTPVDTDFTATVTATDDGEGIEGADVELTTVMPGRDDAPQSGQTDADGRAEFTWSRETPGLEQVLAEVTVDGDTGPAAMAHLWVGAPIGRPGLEVTSDSSLAGAPVIATGRGCPSESDVAFSVGRQRLGGTTARSDGTYRAALDAPDVGIGRHTVTADCAPVTASAPLDVVVTSSATGTAGAAAATVAVVLTFFVLLGGQLMRVNTHTAGGGV